MKGKRHKLVCTLVRDEIDPDCAEYNIVPRGLVKELGKDGYADDFILELCFEGIEKYFPGLKLKPGEAVDITITITEDE